MRIAPEVKRMLRLDVAARLAAEASVTAAFPVDFRQRLPDLADLGDQRAALVRLMRKVLR